MEKKARGGRSGGGISEERLKRGKCKGGAAKVKNYETEGGEKTK